MTIFFDKQYFSDKQEFGKYIQQNILDLAANQSELCCKREEELFYSCNLEDFKYFCDLTIIEGEFISTLEAIKECLGLSSRFPFYLNNYCSYNNIFILDGNQRIEVFHDSTRGDYVNPFYLNTERDCNATIDFILGYNIYKAIPQKLVPSLEFYSEGKLVNSYSAVDNRQIDLSQKGRKSVSFRIPARDIFTQGAGYYVMRFGTSEFAKVAFPRCGLPINGGIYSFSELRDFCNNLNGSPSYDLLSFYNILKRGELAVWLQDNDEEGKYKREIYEAFWKIQAKHPFRIDDLNAILKIISNRIITFPMKEYFSIAISKIISTDIIGKQRVNDKLYYFVPWNSTINGELKVVITPTEICKNLDIDFNLDIKAQSTTLVNNFNINLRDIDTREEKVLDFKITVSNEQNMGESNIYIQDKQGYTQETTVYIVVTGEKLLIPLSNDSSITMIGVYSLKQEPFYIAQTPLTQKQVCALIELIEHKRIRSEINSNAYKLDNLYDAYKKALEHDGENEQFPVSTLWRYAQHSEILAILNSLYPQYEFLTPKIEHLELAARDGCGNEILINHKYSDHLLPVSNGHSTKLCINDIFENVLSITEDTYKGRFFGDNLAYGTSFHETEAPIGIFYRRIKYSETYDIGYRPIMKKRNTEDDSKETVQTSNDSCDGDYDYLNYLNTYDTFL